MADLKPVTVNKKNLLQILETNRDKHAQIYYEAQMGYRKESQKLLTKRLEDFYTPDLDCDLSFSLPKPTSHVSSYNKAIGMLEWSIDETVELDAGQFDNFVNDNWSWQFGFLSQASDIAMSGSLAVSEFSTRYDV